MGAENLKIGAGAIKYKGQNLGLTLGGATFNYEPEYVDILADTWGNTPVDKALLGEVVTIVARLAESSLETMQIMIPSADEDGAIASFGRQAGFRLSTVAGELVFHPQSNAVDDLSEDIVLHKAVVADTVEVNYNNEDQRVFEVTFAGLIDTTKTDGNLIGFFGDSTE